MHLFGFPHMPTFHNRNTANTDIFRVSSAILSTTVLRDFSLYLYRYNDGMEENRGFQQSVSALLVFTSLFQFPTAS